MNFYLMNLRKSSNSSGEITCFPDLNTLLFDLKDFYCNIGEIESCDSPTTIKELLLTESEVNTSLTLENKDVYYITIKKCFL